MPSDISNPGIQPTAQPEDSPPPQCPSGDPVSHKVPALPCAADTASRPRPERLHLSSPGHFREERHQRGSGAREGSRSRDASGCPKTQLDTGTRFPLLPSGGQTWEQPPEVWKAASHHQLQWLLPPWSTGAVLDAGAGRGAVYQADKPPALTGLAPQRAASDPAAWRLTPSRLVSGVWHGGREQGFRGKVTAWTTQLAGGKADLRTPCTPPLPSRESGRRMRGWLSGFVKTASFGAQPSPPGDMVPLGVTKAGKPPPVLKGGLVSLRNDPRQPRTPRGEQGGKVGERSSGVPRRTSSR